jgi:biofilm protein TabA
MRMILYRYLFLFFSLVLAVNVLAQSGERWTKKSADEWFNKGEWLTGAKPAATVLQYDQFGRVLEQSPDDSTSSAKRLYLRADELHPHSSINRIAFAKAYHSNKDSWDKAFAFLQEQNLQQLKPGRYSIDGENVFAIITEGPGKLMDTTMWESHRNYIDIHYVINGKEKIGVAPLSSATIVKKYNAATDLTFYQGKGKYYIAEPGVLFIFFPEDVHRPNLATAGIDMVKKLVIKIRKANP